MSENLGHGSPAPERRDTPRGPFHALLDMLYSILRLIARHVRGFWGALAAFLTLSAIIAIVAALLLALLARMVTGGLTQAFDERVLTWLEANRSPWLDEHMLEITTIGSGLPLILIVFVAVVFLWASKHRWSVYFLLLGTLGGQALNRLLKAEIGRPRPIVVEWAQQVNTLSFPSGHAMSSFIVYGSLAYLVARLAPTPALKRFTWGFAAFMILTVGLSRMYLGVHYPSDVIAGFLGGLAWVTFVAAGMTALRFFAPRRPETRVEERDLEAHATTEATS